MGLSHQTNTRLRIQQVQVSQLSTWGFDGSWRRNFCPSCILVYCPILPCFVHDTWMKNCIHWLGQRLCASSAWEANVYGYTSRFPQQVRISWMSTTQEIRLWKYVCPTVMVANLDPCTEAARFEIITIWPMYVLSWRPLDGIVCWRCWSSLTNARWNRYFCQRILDLGFDLDIEGDFSSYLGIKIDEFKDGTRHMSQKGLIEKVISAAGMKDCNPNWTPTTHASLGSDPDGEPCNNVKWAYPSIVDMFVSIEQHPSRHHLRCLPSCEIYQ